MLEKALGATPVTTLDATGVYGPEPDMELLKAMWSIHSGVTLRHLPEGSAQRSLMTSLTGIF